MGFWSYATINIKGDFFNYALEQDFIKHEQEEDLCYQIACDLIRDVKHTDMVRCAECRNTTIEFDNCCGIEISINLSIDNICFNGKKWGKEFQELFAKLLDRYQVEALNGILTLTISYDDEFEGRYHLDLYEGFRSKRKGEFVKAGE